MSPWAAACELRAACVRPRNDARYRRQCERYHYHRALYYRKINYDGPQALGQSHTEKPPNRWDFVLLKPKKESFVIVHVYYYYKNKIR